MRALDILKTSGRTPVAPRRPRRASSRSWGATRGALALSALVNAACGSVVGPEYTGEVGLELRGKIVHLDEDQKDLVPALVFIGKNTVHLVDLEVTGEYPSQFVLRAVEPPPEEVFDFASEPGRPPLGVAWLVLVEKDHGPSAPAFGEPLLPYLPKQTDPDPETGLYQRTDELCSQDGTVCQTSVYECRDVECELVFEEETPSPTDAYFSSWLDCSGPCLTSEQNCDQQSCSLTVRYCDTDGYGPDTEVSSEGIIRDCTLLSREGEDPYQGRLAHLIASDLLVVFAAEATEVSGLELVPGYNLIRPSSTLDVELWIEETVCERRAELEASSIAGDKSEEEQDALEKALEEECPNAPRFERVLDPAAEELEIKIGSPSALQ